MEDVLAAAVCGFCHKARNEILWGVSTPGGTHFEHHYIIKKKMLKKNYHEVQSLSTNCISSTFSFAMDSYMDAFKFNQVDLDKDFLKQIY